jgi:hypothetical protein
MVRPQRIPLDDGVHMVVVVQKTALKFGVYLEYLRNRRHDLSNLKYRSLALTSERDLMPLPTLDILDPNISLIYSTLHVFAVYPDKACSLLF